MAMGKVGGILMCVSLFLPVWLINITGTILGYTVSATMVYWLFGVYLIMFMGLSYVGFAIEIFSILLFILILIFSIIAIVKEGTPQMVMGILSLVLMASYLVYWYLGVGAAYLTAGLGNFTVTLVPIGGLLCIVGAILATIGGATSRS
jgi:hypothetical protein